MQLPSPDLYDRVIAKINYENKLLKLKRRVFLYAFGLLASSIASAPLLTKLYEDTSRSGFLEFLSLLFTDFQMVAFNLRDYSLSVLESIPATSFSLTLLLAAVFIFSYSKFSDSLMEMKKLRYH